MAGGFAAGSALFEPRVFDPQTTKRLRHFQTQRLPHMTAAELDHEAEQVEALPGPVADELRRLVDAEMETRRVDARLSLAPLAGRRIPWAPISDGCREDAARCGGCYCGKLRKPEDGAS